MNRSSAPHVLPSEKGLNNLDSAWEGVGSGVLAKGPQSSFRVIGAVGLLIGNVDGEVGLDEVVKGELSECERCWVRARRWWRMRMCKRGRHGDGTYFHADDTILSPSCTWAMEKIVRCVSCLRLSFVTVDSTDWKRISLAILHSLFLWMKLMWQKEYCILLLPPNQCQWQNSEWQVSPYLLQNSSSGPNSILRVAPCLPSNLHLNAALENPSLHLIQWDLFLDSVLRIHPYLHLSSLRGLQV